MSIIELEPVPTLPNSNANGARAGMKLVVMVNPEANVVGVQVGAYPTAVVDRAGLDELVLRLLEAKALLP